MKKLLILLLLISVVITGSGLFFYLNLQGTCRKNCNVQVFVVPQGATVNEVLLKLENEKIIRNAFFAKIYLKLINFKGNIQAGDFKLNPASNINKIVATLQKGTLDYWVTIPEGYRAEQVYEKIQKARSTSSSIIRVNPLPAEAASDAAKAGRDVISENPSGSKTGIQTYIDNEGYLFPDTYLIPKNANDENIVSIMKNNFESKIISLIGASNPQVVPTTIKLSSGDEITLQNLIVLASLVEREAKNDSERPIIANIIYKRWVSDWPLQVDATIQYAIGVPDNWWKKELTFDDLRIVSPYNTYLNRGLPPGPICNPGEKAISAVINQTPTDYWYYSTGKDGVTRYAKTLNEHNLNVEQNIQQ